MPCLTTLRCAMPRCAMLSRAVPCCAMLCLAVPHHTALSHAALCCAVLCCAVLCCAVPSRQTHWLNSMPSAGTSSRHASWTSDIRLLALDMDGTLLDSNSKVLPSSIKAVKVEQLAVHASIHISPIWKLLSCCWSSHWLKSLQQHHTWAFLQHLQQHYSLTPIYVLVRMAVGFEAR